MDSKISLTFVSWISEAVKGGPLGTTRHVGEPGHHWPTVSNFQ